MSGTTSRYGWPRWASLDAADLVTLQNTMVDAQESDVGALDDRLDVVEGLLSPAGFVVVPLDGVYTTQTTAYQAQFDMANPLTQVRGGVGVQASGLITFAKKGNVNISMSLRFQSRDYPTARNLASIQLTQPGLAPIATFVGMDINGAHTFSIAHMNVPVAAGGTLAVAFTGANGCRLVGSTSRIAGSITL